MTPPASSSAGSARRRTATAAPLGLLSGMAVMPGVCTPWLLTVAPLGLRKPQAAQRSYHLRVPAWYARVMNVYRALALGFNPALILEAQGLAPDPWQRELLHSRAPHLLLNCPNR